MDADPGSSVITTIIITIVTIGGIAIAPAIVTITGRTDIDPRRYGNIAMTPVAITAPVIPAIPTLGIEPLADQ
jgi:hypothetical protein